jgi:regulatory protein
MAKSISDKAESYAYRLLNYRPRTEQEIRDKLKKKDFSEELIGTLISKLKERSLIDDRNFARLWIESRMQSSSHGFLRIRHELLQKGIDKNIIEDIAEQFKRDFDEPDMAKGLVEARIKSVCGLHKDKARQRLYSYLKRRGFSDSVIYKAINEAYADTQ